VCENRPASLSSYACPILLEAPFAFQYHTRDHLQGKLKITMEKRQAIARCASGQAIFPFLQYYDFFSFFPSKSQGFSPSLSEYDLSGGVQLPILSVKLEFCFVLRCWNPGPCASALPLTYLHSTSWILFVLSISPFLVR
jgi:hypothetical protein